MTIKNTMLINFRDSLKKSQEEMAQMLNVSLSFYIKIEHGLRNPSFNFVSKFKGRFPSANIEDIFFNKEPHAECRGQLSNQKVKAG